MKNHVVGQAAADTAVPQTPIGVLRAGILALIVGSDLFKADEQLRANHNVHACENLATLTKWLANVGTEAESRAAGRRAAAELAHERIAYATASQKEELKALAKKLGRVQRTRILLNINRYTQAQASDLIGRYYTNLTGNGEYGRTKWLVIASDDLTPLLPKGTLASLENIDAERLEVGQLALCQDLAGNTLAAGKVAGIKPAYLRCDKRIKIETWAGAIELPPNSADCFWFRVRITSLAA